jgi:ABC-2 type transport system ATP-binding protein
MSVIDVVQVTKKYGSLRAVDQVSFSVDKGRIFGLLGPNGAGKTSTIRMINYITAPDEGSISIMGQPANSSCILHS